MFRNIADARRGLFRFVWKRSFHDEARADERKRTVETEYINIVKEGRVQHTPIIW